MASVCRGVQKSPLISKFGVCQDGRATCLVLFMESEYLCAEGAAKNPSMLRFGLNQ